MAKMKKGEIALWTAVAILLALNIWLPRQMRHKYSWERDLSQMSKIIFRNISLMSLMLR